MSRVVRVRAPEAGPVPPVARLRLDLAELLAAARLAGDVPLPVSATNGAGPGTRWSERLGDAGGGEPQRAAADAVARADDPGPAGATAALASRGLLAGGTLEDGPAAALRVLAGGPLSVVLDLVVDRRDGASRLRAWFGAGPGLAARLATVDGLRYELAWFDPRRWVAEVARAVTVAPWPQQSSGRWRLPDRAVLPSELLAGALRAHRDHRTDLLPAMAAAHPGVAVGDHGSLRPADPSEVLALLGVLGTGCLGRLRLWAGFRVRDDLGPGVAAWLGLAPGWYELRPGGHATTVLRRGDPAALAARTQPLVRLAQEAA